MMGQYEMCEECMFCKTDGDGWNEPRYKYCEMDESPLWDNEEECFDCDCFRRYEEVGW